MRERRKLQAKKNIFRPNEPLNAEDLAERWLSPQELINLND